MGEVPGQAGGAGGGQGGEEETPPYEWRPRGSVELDGMGARDPKHVREGLAIPCLHRARRLDEHVDGNVGPRPGQGPGDGRDREGEPPDPPWRALPVDATRLEATNR